MPTTRHMRCAFLNGKEHWTQGCSKGSCDARRGTSSHQVTHFLEVRKELQKKQWPVDSSSCMVYFTPVYISLRIQPPSQTVIGVYNHLLRKVSRFHYHSQKVIRSLGNIYIYKGWKLMKYYPSWIWTIICYHKDFVMNQSVFDGSCHQGRVLQSWGRQAVG